MNTHTHANNDSLGEKIVIATAIFLPLIGVIIAMIRLWGWGITPAEMVNLIVFYIISGMGITVGFHRLFTHASFKAHPVVRLMLGIAGSIALNGGLFEWCDRHRKHHLHSDSPEDDHSPYRYGKGFVNSLRGLWFSHTGWIFTVRPPDERDAIKQLRDDPITTFVDRNFVWWIVLSALLPTLFGWITSGFLWEGAVLGLLWGFLVRVCLVHHITWSINSICHLWGARLFATSDQSRNNLLCALTAFGEGWHNNHHRFQWSAKQGLLPWQFDPSWWFICALEKVGLVSDLKVPSKEQIDRALAETLEDTRVAHLSM